MGQGRTRGTCSFCNGTGTEILNRVERLTSALKQYTDEIDDVVGALHGAINRPANAQICLNSVDLADIAQRLKVVRDVGIAHGDPDAVAAASERTHYMASQEA